MCELSGPAKAPEIESDQESHVRLACLGQPGGGPNRTRNEATTYESLSDTDHDVTLLTMANVVQPHPQIDFHSSSLGHPQMAFGLTLSMPSSLVGLSPHAHTNVPQPPTSAINPSRTLKRRFEQDDEQADTSSGNSPGARDVAMERSPTPERPKRATPKRARNGATFAQGPKGEKSLKEHSSVENQDVDVGVLLG